MNFQLLLLVAITKTKMIKLTVCWFFSDVFVDARGKFVVSSMTQTEF